MKAESGAPDNHFPTHGFVYVSPKHNAFFLLSLPKGVLTFSSSFLKGLFLIVVGKVMIRILFCTLDHSHMVRKIAFFSACVVF